VVERGLPDESGDVRRRGPPAREKKSEKALASPRRGGRSHQHRREGMVQGVTSCSRREEHTQGGGRGSDI